MAHYNHIAAQNPERLAALSDGVFAVAMTLLVLDLHVPATASIHAEQDLVTALRSLAPQLLVYMMSFLTLGIFWIGQQTQLNQFTRANRDLSWVNLAFLFVVTLTPFSTGLMAAYVSFRTALILYWLNILALGLLLLLSWRVADRAGLVTNPSAALTRAIEQRILRAQGLYAIGAALCWFGTYWSLGFIILVQLNYALAPAFRRTAPSACE